MMAHLAGASVLLRLIAVLSCATAATLAFAQSSDGVKRIPYPPPNQNFPISGLVSVPPGYETIYVSGIVAKATNPDAPKGGTPEYGDTKTQTISVLKQMQALLEKQQLSMGDIVMMHVYLAGDPKMGGKMDFAGMMAGYTQFFGTTEQPNKPARAAMQVAALALPGLMVEIEAIAVRKHGAHAEPAGLK
jgi:enamine deaminase RidA (YjgF/YER057c/UK114 family)